MALWLGRTLEDLNPFWHFGLPTAHWAEPRLFWALVNLADGIHIGPDEKEQKIKENAVLLELFRLAECKCNSFGRNTTQC